jgi:protease-4
MRKRTWAALAAALLAGEASASPPLAPGDLGGEARSLLRDVDRTRTHVAGEADAAAVVANPANMGFLRAVGGVVEGSWARATSQRRGSGVGVFVAVPLSLRLLGVRTAENFLALGVGYQHLRPTRIASGLASLGELGLGSRQQADMPYSKLSLSLAVPLMRWAPGLSLGLAYSRTWSNANILADGLHQFDLALSYRPHRVVALGLVARAVNVPKAGHAFAPDEGYTLEREIWRVVQPFELDPEIAVRPIRGRRALELAVGARIVPIRAFEPRFSLLPVAPRGRVEAGGRGARVFAEAEAYAHVPYGADRQPPQMAWRLTGGIEVDLAHVGLAAAPVLGGGADGQPLAQGLAAKLRVSAERYASVAASVGEAVRLDVGKFRGDRGMYRLVEALDALARQHRPVVVLEIDDLKYGWAQIEEVREAVGRLRRAGGKVAAHLRGGGTKDYFLASAAERIYAHPHARLSVVGLRVEVFFFADLLARLGAKAEFVRVAEYKSRPEQFSERTSTEPSQQQRALLLSDTWNHLVRTIAADRRTTPEAVVEWIDAAPHTPEEARARGLVDELGHVDELDERLSAWTGRRVKLRAPSKRERHAEAYGPGPAVAVLHVEGTMSDGESLEVPIVGSKLAGSKTLVRAVKALREDRSVKAIVVRIDSPGGSVACADDVSRELELTARHKPVVISMGDVAASGGYYIATAGQYVFADALTRTGSIGIFRPKVDLSGTLKMFGIGVDELGLGANAGLYSWFKPYTPAERAAAQRGIEAQYRIFVERVARARAMAPGDVDRVARGRVWSGVRARELGLVDAYGGLREAVVYARTRAGLAADDGEVRHYPAAPTVVERVQAVFGLRLPSPLGEAGDGRALPGAPRAIAGAQSEADAASPLAAGALIWVLRRLPAALWLMDGPEPLALAEEVVTLE